MSKNQDTDSFVNNTREKTWFFFNNTILILFTIAVIGLFLRMYYFTPEIPLTLDALRYFWYANDLSLLGNFPIGHYMANNGWPTFLSIFFIIFRFDNFYEYMLLQKTITTIISISTIIPIYLLCKIFVKRSFAIIGAAIFCFEPRLIQNSVLGITEPLYILTGTIAIFLFLNKNTKYIFVSFALIGICALIRSEALVLLPVFSIMYFVRFRKDTKQLLKYGFCVLIFFLVLTPMSIIKIDTMGDDLLFSRVFRAVDFSVDKIVNESNLETDQSNYLLHGIENFIKFLGWSTIPIFLLLIPVGFVLFFKKMNYEKITILLTLFAMCIPIFYALSQFSDTRYLFVLYPIFCIFSSIFLEKVFTKKRYKNLVLGIVIGVILTSSIIFLEINKIDSEHELESIKIAKIVSERTEIVNHYLPESKYIQTVEMEKMNEFPILFSESINETTQVIRIDGETLKEYLLSQKERKLTHLVVDENESEEYRPLFFKKIFQNEDNYPYLTKIYDSKNDSYNYHVKIFKINYNSLS